MSYETRPKFMDWCNEQQWENLKNTDLSYYNPASINFIPSPLDHGLTYEQWDEYSEEEQAELNRLLIEKLRSKKKARIKRIVNGDIERAAKHWYNNTPHKDIISAIEKTRCLVDEVIDFINEKETIDSIRIRNERLRNIVKNDEIRIRLAEDKKLKRFPRYISSTNELAYSKGSLLTLWVHVFSKR